MNKKPHSIEKKVLTRIYSHGRGWVFTPIYFSDLGTRTTIGVVLHRLLEKGTIRQLDRGLYDYPIIDKELGILQPSVKAVVNALIGRDEIRIQPSGAYAVNLLGLSTQVPMKIVYLTDGKSRIVRIGKRQIIFKQTTPRNMATAGRISGLIIQALRHLGKQQVDDTIIKKLEHRLDEAACKQIFKDIKYAPAWIADIFRKLATMKEVVS